MNKYQVLKNLIIKDEKLSWVYDQLQDTFAHGISKDVIDTETDGSFIKLEPTNISATDRNKRKKYRTTRGYSDEEKYELLLEGIKKVFIEVPAFEQAAINYLEKFIGENVSIDFLPPEEIEKDYISNTKYHISRDSENAKKYENNYKKFLEIALGENDDFKA